MKKVRFEFDGKAHEMTINEFQQGVDEVKQRAMDGDKSSLAVLYVAQSATEKLDAVTNVVATILEAHSEQERRHTKAIKFAVDTLSTPLRDDKEKVEFANEVLVSHLTNFPKTDPVGASLVNILLERGIHFDRKDESNNQTSL